MSKYLVDSSVWISLLHKRDTNQNRSFKFFSETSFKDIILLDHVYTEILNVVSRKFNRIILIKFVTALKIMHLDSLTYTSSEEFDIANEIFFKYKSISFTDCILISSAIINGYKVKTFDKKLMQTYKEEFSSLEP